MSSKQDDNVPTPFRNMHKTVFSQRTAAACATHLLPYLKSHFRILDVGCGTGSITVDLARLVPDGLVIGVDINEDALATARSSAEEQGVKNIEFRSGNAQDLKEMESESFDIVHAHQVLLYLSKPIDVMREMRRLAKPGGFVSTRDNAYRIVVPTIPAVAKNVEVFERLASTGGGDLDFGRRNHVVAHDAGFMWEDIEMSSWGWEYSGKQGREVWVQGAKNSAAAAFIKLGLATKEENEEFAEGWEEWEQRPDARYMGLDGALLCWK